MAKIIAVKWSIIASVEFEQSVDWLIYKFGRSVALEFAQNIFEKIDRLTINPEIGRLSLHLDNCRQTIVPPYHILIYRIENQTLEIVRLFDGRQNLSRLDDK